MVTCRAALLFTSGRPCIPPLTTKLSTVKLDAIPTPDPYFINKVRERAKRGPDNNNNFWSRDNDDQNRIK